MLLFFLSVERTDFSDQMCNFLFMKDVVFCFFQKPASNLMTNEHT